MFKFKNRLRKTKEIEQVMKLGKSRSGKFFGLKYMKNEIEEPRFAIVISKKVHKSAVQRNRKKRQIREVLREFVKDGVLKTSNDYVIFVQKQILDVDYNGIKQDLSDLFANFS